MNAPVSYWVGLGVSVALLAGGGWLVFGPEIRRALKERRRGGYLLL